METTAKTNGHVQRSESEWQAIMKHFSRGGRSRAAFCRAEGISRSTFDVWHRKLRSQKSTPSKQSEFVEVNPVPEQLGGWSVEIELPDGTLARIRG